MVKTTILERPVGGPVLKAVDRHGCSAALSADTTNAEGIDAKRVASRKRSFPDDSAESIDSEPAPNKATSAVLDNSGEGMDTEHVQITSAVSDDSTYGIDAERVAKKAMSTGSDYAAERVDAESAKKHNAMREGDVFPLTVTYASGACKQVDDIVLDMTVADLVAKIQQTSGFGDCLQFQDVITLLINDRLVRNHERLKDVGLSASSLVSLVVHDLVTLKLSDGCTLRVSREIACMSNRIRTAVDDNGADDEIPIPDCKKDDLIKAMEYCAYHKDNPADEILKPLPSNNLEECGVSAWDADFVNIEQEKIFNLVLAANSLDIKPLLDLACAKIASMIKGKNTEEIRKQFNIVNDFTPEEEAQVREENRWCEDA